MAQTDWTKGYGVIRHAPETVLRVENLIERHWQEGALQHREEARALFAAADRLASAAMWVVAHMTYAQRVDLSGAPVPADAFKPTPEGHTGGSLNMAIAFVGYLLANALSGCTRSWVLGQGHCVAAIEAINALIGDVSPAQEGRYDRSEAGLSRLASDFYSYALTSDGRPAHPLGSHVSAHTAGGISEGGYLGFADVEYVHMPLKGERLVAFLSDGAFEEQRGSDWSPRWWRASDTGFVTPVMILNGRRIEQRTEIGQEGGADWLEAHLRLNGFEPMLIDGHDPAAYAWAILEAEAELRRFAMSDRPYPAQLPYVVARCTKGFGFPGAGTNRAHNLPLEGNPSREEAARAEFNEGARALFVPRANLDTAVAAFSTHDAQNRPRESRHALATRNVAAPALPPPRWSSAGDAPRCAMDALDEYFVAILAANPQLRPRVGNPDELKSNHMGRTLEALKHRVNAPEPGTPEAVDGAIITALNEEAVIGAALANKGGISLSVSYEAFAMKMLGALRQEIIFARRQKEIGRPPRWLSVPLIATSHTWENAKNEQSHQDPTLPEALMGEMADAARVLFPLDANSAVACLRSVYATHGQIACLVTPKRETPFALSGQAAEHAVAAGAAGVAGSLDEAKLQLVSVGAYQVLEALKAHQRLTERGVKSCVTAMLEPARFRAPRDDIERNYLASDEARNTLFPPAMPRIIAAHTRPEPMLGHLRPIDGGQALTRAHGYLNRGGTLDVFGMLFANRTTWAHLVESAASLLNIELSALLTNEEADAIAERGDPLVLGSSGAFQ